MAEILKEPKHNPQIKQIFEELQKNGYIKSDRILKPKNDKKYGFMTYPFDPFREGIHYENKISGLSDNSIRFFLLHEEGHLIKGHYGCLLRIAIEISGLFIIIFSLFATSLQSILNPNYYPSITSCGIGIFLGLFLIFISTSLAVKSLEMDEYESDIFTAKILQEKFSMERPSEFLKTAFVEMKRYFDSLPEEQHSIPEKIFQALIEYHPTQPQRIDYVKFWVDNAEKVIKMNCPHCGKPMKKGRLTVGDYSDNRRGQTSIDLECAYCECGYCKWADGEARFMK